MASITKNEPACSRPLDDLIRERAPLAALQRFLIERGHARQTVYAYLDRAAHFCRWAERTKLDLRRSDEKVMARFCDDHLAHCDCGWPTHTDRREASAALGHLLLVLRVLGVAGPSAERGTPVDEELHRFDEHMDQVRGLASSSRQTILRIVRELLWGRFHERPIVISAITPEYVRRFVAKLTERYHGPASVGSVISALRGYFRFRATTGDPVGGLLCVLSYPANWQHASLPKTLTDQEIERLLTSLNWPGPSMRRSAAIVRCAVDLGLRSGEIAALQLDDIDWREGTLRLRRTKSRREQVLPLPEATGRAIAAYLQHERPKAAHRGIFVRRKTPRDQPIKADLVRKTIRQAYQRAGLPYTRSHLLRHTMARRLLDGSLTSVALPWPAALPPGPPQPPPPVALPWPERLP